MVVVMMVDLHGGGDGIMQGRGDYCDEEDGDNDNDVCYDDYVGDDDGEDEHDV